MRYKVSDRRLLLCNDLHILYVRPGLDILNHGIDIGSVFPDFDGHSKSRNGIYRDGLMDGEYVGSVFGNL